MTMLICWATYKAGELNIPNSIYIASDSRITWGTPEKHWDGARKVFACRIEPHLFGYCGDVVFPSLVIAQIVTAIDNGVLFSARAGAQSMHEVVVEILKKSFRRRRNTPDQDFSILHALRTGEDEAREFSVWQISYDYKKEVWKSSPLIIPATTETIVILGSGKPLVEKYLHMWRKSYAWGKSAAIFSAFSDALFSAADKHSGGMPQIGSLNPGSHAQIIGYIDEDDVYLNGLEVVPVNTMRRILWFNRHFEVCSPATKKRQKKARRHARPREL